MPAASATLRASFHAMRVNGLADSAMSINSGSSYACVGSSAGGGGTAASAGLAGN
ncbi:hypothetical protein OKW34_002042 [Paraburkholderia youngii]